MDACCLKLLSHRAARQEGTGCCWAHNPPGPAGRWLLPMGGCRLRRQALMRRRTGRAPPRHLHPASRSPPPTSTGGRSSCGAPSRGGRPGCWPRLCCSAHWPAAVRRASGSRSGVHRRAGQGPGHRGGGTPLKHCSARQPEGAAARSEGCQPGPAAAAASGKPAAAAAAAALRPPLSRCHPPPPPARPTHPGERCHEIGFTYVSFKQLQGNEGQAAKEGREYCSDKLGSEWTWVRTEQDTPWDGDGTWRAYCRRCGLPNNAILLW